MADKARALATWSLGGGERLVLVHGFTQTGRSWLPIARQLADRYHVSAVDAPGHGGSADVDTDLPDGAALLGAAGGRATYVGYSMGGRLCLHLALAHAALVERLVLVGATPGLSDPAERAARRRSDEQLAEDLERDGVEAFLDPWLSNPMFAGLPDDPADRADRGGNTAAGLASSLRRCGTGTQADLWPEIGRITCPTLLITGERDHKFTEIARRMKSAMPRAELVVVPGAGHAAHLERPAEVIRLVREFLQAHPVEQLQAPSERKSASDAP